jgi:hypothetical protein
VTAPASGDPVPERRLVSRPTGHAGRVPRAEAVPAVFDWQQTGDSRTWVAEIPGRPGDLLVVTQLGRGRYQPVVEGPARLRGPVTKTRLEAQAWAEKRVQT